MNPKKQFGIFTHQVHHETGSPFLTGMEKEVTIPTSRWRGELAERIAPVKDLQVLIDSPEVGPHMIIGHGGRDIFVQGHPEYDQGDIAGEYLRDKEKGIDINVPAHYFPNDDDTKLPDNTWTAQGQIFYNNWIRWLNKSK
jgi:homoserine O-succinyltransferase